jgi:hypothetical protein
MTNMKVHIELDITPEEARRLYGLPDLTEINSKMLEGLRDTLASGGDSTLGKLLGPIMANGLSSIESYNKMMWSLLSRGKTDSKQTDSAE